MVCRWTGPAGRVLVGCTQSRRTDLDAAEANTIAFGVHIFSPSFLFYNIARRRPDYKTDVAC